MKHGFYLLTNHKTYDIIQTLQANNTKLILSSEYKAILSMPQRTNLIQYRPYNGELRVAEFSPKMV